MTYDQWKTDSGYHEREECWHEQFDIDLDGTAHCEMCDETWRASADEIRVHRNRQAEYDSWCRKQERREFWRRITLPIRWPLFRLLDRIWPRKALSVLLDEEIPF